MSNHKKKIEHYNNIAICMRDPTKGYTNDNIMLVTESVAAMKGDLPEEVFHENAFLITMVSLENDLERFKDIYTLKELAKLKTVVTNAYNKRMKL